MKLFKKSTEKAKKKNISLCRRIFARLPVNLSLDFLAKGQKKEERAEAIDISANGIGFISKTRLSSNTRLKMWLNMPDGCAPLYITGKVIWCKCLDIKAQKWRSGIYFEKPDLIGLGRIFAPLRHSVSNRTPSVGGNC